MRRKSLWVLTLLAIALLSAACSHQLSNQQIETKLKARMSSDAQLVGSSLHIRVNHGVVTLSGKVPSVAARYEAFKVASDATGVKKVNDRMTIEEPSVASRSAANGPPTRPAPAPRKPAPTGKLHFHPVPNARPVPLKSLAANGTEEAAAQPEHATAAPAAAATPAVKSPAPAAVERITVPQGTHVSVRMVDSISSAVNQVGDIFHASLAKPLVVGGKVLAPKGTNVYLRLVNVHSAGHLRGRSELRVELYRLVLHGNSYPLVSNDYEVKGPSRGKRSALSILGGAAVGTAIGAFAGGGKGAAIGAAAGGGGGAAYEGLTKGKQVHIPSEALIHFKLEQPLSVTVPATNSGSSATSAASGGPNH